MGHVGFICPNMTSHINVMMALAHALRSRGHQATFFLLGRGPASVRDAGFRVVEMGGGVFPPDEYQAQLQRLGTLSGRAATRHTVAIGVRATEAILQDGVSVVRDCGVIALMVVPFTNDQPGVAARVVASGTGAMLPLKKITAHRLPAKVQRVRGDPAYQVATQRMAGAILPRPSV